MTERELEQRLRSWYRADVDEADSALAALRASVAAIPDEMPYRPGFFGSRRGVLLVVAALLVALLVGSAIAAGAGLLRLPWLPDDRNLIVTAVSDERLGPTPCDQTLAEGLSLWVQVSDQQSAPYQILVYPDGLVLRGLMFEDPEETRPWEQRRLTAEGLEALLGAVAASGLRDCVDVPVPGPQLEVKALAAGGVVAMSLGSGWFRAAPQAEVDAAIALSELLLDDGLGVEAARWLDADWRPYALERWEIRVSMWEGYEKVYAGAERVAWRELILPGGETPMTYGQPVAVSERFIFDAERCQIVSPIDAAEMRQFIDGVAGGVWQLRDADGGVAFNIQWRLPHQPGCMPYGDRSPPVARENLIEDMAACDYLPEDVIAEVVSEPWAQFEFQSETHGDGGWVACEYWQGWIFASRHRTTAEEASSIVEIQFGPGYSTDEIASRTVYFNACLHPGAECKPAIAISVEPHLVIIVPSEGDEEMLRSLAAALIDRLDS
jgi:hypothetical protein